MSCTSFITGLTVDDDTNVQNDMYALQFFSFVWLNAGNPQQKEAARADFSKVNGSH